MTDDIVEVMARELCRVDCREPGRACPMPAGCNSWEAFTVDARAALEALRAAGYAVVPREATIDMSIAFAETFYAQRRAIDDHDISDWWSAMIEAGESE